jgi:hypothetical protein
MERPSGLPVAPGGTGSKKPRLSAGKDETLVTENINASPFTFPPRAAKSADRSLGRVKGENISVHTVIEFRGSI